MRYVAVILALLVGGCMVVNTLEAVHTGLGFLDLIPVPDEL